MESLKQVKEKKQRITITNSLEYQLEHQSDATFSSAMPQTTPHSTMTTSTATAATQSEVLVIQNSTSQYGAAELKEYIKLSTIRGFVITTAFLFIILVGYLAFTSITTAIKAKGPAINKVKLTQLPPPPASQNETPPPPPITTPGPAARAGTPVPVPDALISPDMKDFAAIDEVSRASSTGGDGNDEGFLGLAKDVSVEVREEEPDAYDFVSVEKEPYIDLTELQKKVVYPEIARRAGIEGKVNIRVLVGKNGKPKKYIIESTDSELLNSAAATAVMNSVFTPAILGNQPIDCWVSIPINFRMK
jgi:protein TonB